MRYLVHVAAPFTGQTQHCRRCGVLLPMRGVGHDWPVDGRVGVAEPPSMHAYSIGERELDDDETLCRGDA